MQRSTQKELLDLGPSHYSMEEYLDCLGKLEKIGRWLGGDAASFSAFSSLPSTPASILDVGCGLGAFTIKLAIKYPNAQVLGIDIDPKAVESAIANKKNYEKTHSITLPNLIFEKSRLEDLPHSSCFDVITATLLCHHLEENELIEFLKLAERRAKKAVLLNDLQRSLAAFFLFWSLSRFINNRLIRVDGLLSIRRSLIKEEWLSVLQKAKISRKNCFVEKKRGFRFIVKIMKEGNE